MSQTILGSLVSMGKGDIPRNVGSSKSSELEPSLARSSSGAAVLGTKSVAFKMPGKRGLMPCLLAPSLEEVTASLPASIPAYGCL